jgi:hypothetical protein
MMNTPPVPLTLSSRPTIQIIYATREECKERIALLKKDIEAARQAGAKSTVKNLKNKVAILEKDYNVRDNIFLTICNKGEFSTPFYHFYKDHPACHHRRASTLGDREALTCLEFNCLPEAREQYHNMLKTVPLENQAIIEAFQPGFLSRLSDRFRCHRA